MSASRKSEWTSVSCRSEREKKAVLSWFGTLCDGMTPEKAEVLCDIETNREKKLRVLMVRQDGRREMVSRTLGTKNYTIKFERMRP